MRFFALVLATLAAIAAPAHGKTIPMVNDHVRQFVDQAAREGGTVRAAAAEEDLAMPIGTPLAGYA